jgi:hypothetical protein
VRMLKAGASAPGKVGLRGSFGVRAQVRRGPDRVDRLDAVVLSHRELVERAFELVAVMQRDARGAAILDVEVPRCMHRICGVEETGLCRASCAASCTVATR